MASYWQSYRRAWRYVKRFLLSAALIRQLGRESLEIVFLGTGAALPSKYRNVTGIYLDFFQRGGMLVDCGEGTYGQLRRRYGSRADEIVKHLRLIWISHIHADHHVGISRWAHLHSESDFPSAAHIIICIMFSRQRKGQYCLCPQHAFSWKWQMQKSYLVHKQDEQLSCEICKTPWLSERIPLR